MAEAQSALRELRPEVLLLQEVRHWPAVQSLIEVEPNLVPLVVSDFGQQNQAIASSFPADSGWAEGWKPSPARPPRGYAFAALSLSDRRHLLVYSLHLKSNRGDFRQNIAQRAAATGQLLRHVQAMLTLYGKRGPCAVIVAGDLNTSLDTDRFSADPTLRALRSSGFHWTHEGVRLAKRITVPGGSDYPDDCFDHLLTLGLGRPTARVLRISEASDHSAVVLDLDLTLADFRPAFDLAAGERELSRQLPPAPARPVAPAGNGSLQASDDEGIRALIGQNATIHGRVARIGQTKDGGITFINFEGNSRDEFVAIVRDEHLPKISSAVGGELSRVLPGRAVRITGRLELFRGTPQIALTRPEQLKLDPR